MSKFLKIFIIFVFIFLLTSFLSAQTLTGSIKGKVVDSEGNPLPGVNITASSPALIGTISFLTTKEGVFRFPSLPPGVYTLTCELTGFQTVKREGIIVTVGMTVEVSLEMKISPIAEAVTVTAPSPVVDVESSKVAVSFSSSMLANIPITRDLYDVVNSTPGAVSEGVSYRRTTSIHGSTVRQNVYSLDGAGMNDPMVGYPITNINFDVMEEVEISTGGQPAEVGFAEGGHINIVTKSGGNRFSGGATFYYTREDLNKVLFPKEQIEALGLTAPRISMYNFDGSGVFGGPIKKDKLWFFSNLRTLGYKDKGVFIPFTDPQGKYHPPWDFEHSETMGFFKLSTQLSKDIRATGMLNVIDIYRPVYSEPTWNYAKEWTRVWNHEKGYTGTLIATWLINSNTFLDLRTWYVHRFFPLHVQPGMDNATFYYDAYTARYWGGSYYNEEYLRTRIQGGAYLTRYFDNLLGGNHEIKAGVEAEQAYGDTDHWKQNPMRWYFYDGNYLRWPSLKRGYIIFTISPANKGESVSKNYQRRYSAFVQDSVDFGRLHLNLGLRWDYSHGWQPKLTKGKSGSDLAVYVGETVLKPAYGINPYEYMEWPEWKDIIIFNSLSPRFGIVYDVFDNGKTAFKASYSIYNEYMLMVYYSALSPNTTRNFFFYWYDDNKNASPDTGDRFVHTGVSPIVMTNEFIKRRIDPDINAPSTREFIAGIQQEIMKNFSVTLNFIHKKKTNIIEDIRYDVVNMKAWNTYEKAPEWWVPFTTIVPAYGIFPAREVTLYAPKVGAPEIVWRLMNVPEGERKYQGLEIVFNKRMADRWQLSGSIVWSKFWGNIDAEYWDADGWTGAFDSPNYYVNRWGRVNMDRPLMIKLMGTVVLPYRINLSAYYRHFPGSPWGRTVTVYFPSAWMKANNIDTRYNYWGIQVENPGTQRTQQRNIFDIRFEKEFSLGRYGKIGAYLDVFNLFGDTQIYISQNPGGEWYPVDANTASGAYKVSGTYKKPTGLSGQREVRISIRYSF